MTQIPDNKAVTPEPPKVVFLSEHAEILLASFLFLLQKNNLPINVLMAVYKAISSIFVICRSDFHQSPGYSSVNEAIKGTMAFYMIGRETPLVKNFDDWPDNSYQLEPGSHPIMLDFLKRLSPSFEMRSSVRFLSEVMGASEAETRLVGLAWAHSSINAPGAMTLFKELAYDEEILSVLLGCSRQDFEDLARGKLVGCGLLRFNGNGNILFSAYQNTEWQKPRVSLSPFIMSVLLRNPSSKEEFLRLMTGRKVSSEVMRVTWDDFDHLGRLREIALECVREGGAAHVLLVGPPGTGKTEFAALLAKAAAVDLYAVGESGINNGEPDRATRLSAVTVASTLLGHGCAILLDEAEDVLMEPSPLGGGRDQFSKAHLNLMLEGGKRPVIWTANRTSGMDPAVLRRMSLVIPFPEVGPEIRERIWNRVLDAEDGARERLVGLDMAALARKWTASPALCATAVRRSLTAGDVEVVLGGFGKVMGRMEALDHRPGITDIFDPELSRADTGLPELARQLVRAGPVDWSLLMEGPSGTGKSAFATFVAKALGLEVMERNASDLMGKYVGETERLIAAMFAEAKAERKIIILNEVDGLMASRGSAVRNWEVTQVNEMLVRLEAHPLPVFATTNRREGMDAAVMRRFTFKVRFHEMDEAASRLAFQRILDVEIPISLRIPHGLTPGDLANLRKQFRIIGKPSPERILEMALAEAEARGGLSRSIGF